MELALSVKAASSSSIDYGINCCLLSHSNGKVYTAIFKYLAHFVKI